MKRILILCSVALLGLCVSAQNTTTSSSSMTASPWAQQVPFDIAADGEKFNFTTGMGGWSDIQFAYKQRNWVGQEHVNIARVGFLGRHSTSSSQPTALSDAQKSSIDAELNNIAPTGAMRLLLLCDLEESSGKLSESSWCGTLGIVTNTVKRRRNNYVKDIQLAVEYIESKGYTVVAVAPFNEPDYNALGNCGGTAKAFNVVAELMQGNATLKGRVFGPNTLNNTKGVEWYSTVKNNINWVNTHQLDGTFADLKSFWNTGVSEGKRALADEMHNVMEAMVVMNHGGEYGTWWGYDGVARAEFARMTSMGEQLVYKEDLSNFAVAGVYRYDEDKAGATGRVKAVIGSSERNALPTAFTYLSKGRLAYFDGYGPTYDFTQSVPGGTGYWKGQTNAERVHNVVTGEDVPMWPVAGNYKLVNKKSGKVLSTRNGELFGVARICQYADGVVDNQEWSIRPVGVSVGGDFSYHFITNVNTSDDIYHLDDLDWSLDEGKEVIIYPGGGSGCEQWHVRYVGDGYYTIINRHSGLCLEVLDGKTTDGASVVQMMVDESDEQLWKLVPADAVVDAVAPAKPAGLKAESRSGSILLQWNDAAEKDIYGYNVYRYNASAGIWECVGRAVKGTSFLDNTCRKGQSLRYRIKAVDRSINFSEASDEIVVTTAADNALVGKWGFAGNLKDATENELHAVCDGVLSFEGSGTNAGIELNGEGQFVKLPYHVGDMKEMTFAAWVKGSSTTAWQRIFDFGNGEDEYLFLTPTNGSAMRFEIKKDGTVQGLNATTTLGTGTWKHVAVTIGADKVAIYIDGVANATTTEIKLRPSDIAPAMSYLGRSQFDADPTFNGSIGDVRIYNYALTDSEVAALTKQKSTPQAADSPYELTSEFIPSLAEVSGNWTTITGNYTTVTSGYTRIYRDGSNKIDGVNVALKNLAYMPMGAYRVTAQVATNNDASNVWITAQDEQASAYTSGVTTYKTFTVDATVEEGDDFNFNLGLRQVHDEWGAGAKEVRATDYHLYYIGSKVDFEEAMRKMLESYIEKAGDFSSEPMNKDVRASFEAAVSVAQATCDRLSSGSLGTTHANVVAAIEALLAARAQAQASVDAYRGLGVQIASAYAKHLLYPQKYGYDDFSEALTGIEDDYYEGNYADDEIPSAIIEVKTASNRYMMADAVMTATIETPVDVTARILEQASFENNSYAPYWETSPAPGGGSDGVEFFNVNFNLCQVLYGMPAGTYRLQTHGFYRYGSQSNNYDAQKNGSLQRNAKLYIAHSEGVETADVMAISDDPVAAKGAGNWYAYDGKYVPDNIQAAGVAIDELGKYGVKDGYNSVDVAVTSEGMLIVGAKKEVQVSEDWTFFGDFSLYYLGDGKRRIVLDEKSEVIPEIDETIIYDEVTLKRTLKAGVWNSFVSPFDIPGDMLGGWEVKRLAHSSFNDKDGLLLLTFEDVEGGIVAGTPYMVRNTTMTEDLTEIKMDGVQLCATPSTVVTPEGHVAFTGVYHYDYMPKGAFFISNNTFYQVKEDEKNRSKAFRAYLMPIGDAAKARSLSYRTDGQFDDTSVQGAASEATVVAIYNAHGVRIDDMQEGLNILQMSDGTRVKVMIR